MVCWKQVKVGFRGVGEKSDALVLFLCMCFIFKTLRLRLMLSFFLMLEVTFFNLVLLLNTIAPPPNEIFLFVGVMKSKSSKSESKSVATPLRVQNTLTRKKIYIYNNLNFFICLPLKKNWNILKQYQEHSQNFYAKQIFNQNLKK